MLAGRPRRAGPGSIGRPRLRLFATGLAVLLGPAAARCGDPEECAAPAAIVVEAEGPLPSWATGELSRFEVDVEVHRIDAGGAWVAVVDGGDFCTVRTGAARVEDGRVRLVHDDEDVDPLELVRGDDGRTFRSTGDGARCEWVELFRGARCGRGAGGCGGWGDAVPCTWDEASACAADRLSSR